MGAPFDTGLSRLLRLAIALGQGKPVTTAYIRSTFGVSAATAKRDMLRLECALPVTVTEVRVPGPHPQRVLTLCGADRSFVPLLRASAA